MKKILAFLLAAVLMLAAVSCGGGKDTETTTEPVPPVTTPEQTDAPETTASTPEQTTDTAAPETTAQQPETTDTDAPETTASEPEQTTVFEPKTDEAPEVFLTNGTVRIKCLVVEQSTGFAFDLSEGYAALPVIEGKDFFVEAPASNSVYYGTYMLYNSKFESLGMVTSLEQLAPNFEGAGTYYVRISVNVGASLLTSKPYYAYAALTVTE